MKKYKFQALLLSAFCICLLVACDKKKTPEPEDDNSERAAMLKYVADDIIIPSYDNFKVKMDDLVAKSDSFSKSSTLARLLELREAWQSAYIEWQKVELFDVGPAEKIGLRTYMNIYPVDVSEVAKNIANAKADMEAKAANSTQGFSGLDYLLNGVGASDDLILEFYTSSADADKNKAYIKRVIYRMDTLFTKVHDDWKGSYRNTFVNSASLDQNSEFTNLINGYIMNYEKYIRSGKFGIPAGALSGVKYAEKVEAFYKKDLSKVLAQTAHQASIDFFNGVSVKTGLEGKGLKSYLNSLNARDVDSDKLLSEVINKQFTRAENKIDSLASDFHDIVLNDNQKMLNAYDQLQLSVGFLKVDMVSAMSVTINYFDQDGD